MNEDRQDVDSASDSGSFAEALSIRAYQSGGLVNYVKTLARYAAQAGDPHEKECFALASILTAVAAVEANLTEFVVFKYNLTPPSRFFRKTNQEKYELIKNLRRTQNPQDLLDELKVKPKEEPLKPKPEFDTDHPEVAKLIGCRNAITHSEPDNPRSISYNRLLNSDGARWAAETAQAFAYAIWGADMPEWLKRDLQEVHAAPLDSQPSVP